jgi:hypothetical protein
MQGHLYPQEKRKRIAMERVGEPPLKKRATSSTIAVANAPSRQKEKRKQPSGWKEPEIIDLSVCSSDDDILAKVRFYSISLLYLPYALVSLET